jgi:hypothetical protein
MVLIRPYKATHALLTTEEGRKALVGVDDLDTLAGTSGTLKWMRMTRDTREVLGVIKFNGKIEEIKSDYQNKRKRS